MFVILSEGHREYCGCGRVPVCVCVCLFSEACIINGFLSTRAVILVLGLVAVVAIFIVLFIIFVVVATIVNVFIDTECRVACQTKRRIAIQRV